MWTDSLRHFHFWCQKTLPLVYDDSLSYYEVLAKLTKHLNELTTLVNEIGDELERYEGVTDDRLDSLETWRTEVDTWRAQIDQWKTSINTWIEQTDDWKQSTENHLTAHDNWISYATGLINNTIMPFIEDMTTRVGNIETVLNSEYTYLGTVNYNSTDNRVYITLNTSTSCDKLQALVDFEVKSDIARLTHKPIFYLTFDSDVISHFENESYPVDSRIYFQDLNADVFSYMKQGSNDIILDGLAIVMSDYNTLKTVKSGVTYRAFYIGNGLYYSFENVGTDIENRLIGAENDIVDLESRVDDAEDDITDTQNRMQTSEQRILMLSKAARFIPIYVTYDSTLQEYQAYCGVYGDAEYIKDNLTAAAISGSLFGSRTWFLMNYRVNTAFDFTKYIYLYDDYGNKIKYGSDDAYIEISTGGDGIFSNSVTDDYLYLLDTTASVALYYKMPSANSGQLPRPTNPSIDNGKVVAYNETLKNYELITPSGGSSHTYSTTEQAVGTWIDGKTVYERVFVLDAAISTSANNWLRVIQNDFNADNIILMIVKPNGLPIYPVNGMIRDGYIEVMSPTQWNVKTIILQYTKSTV